MTVTITFAGVLIIKCENHYFHQNKRRVGTNVYAYVYVYNEKKIISFCNDEFLYTCRLQTPCNCQDVAYVYSLAII